MIPNPKYTNLWIFTIFLAISFAATFDQVKIVEFRDVRYLIQEDENSTDITNSWVTVVLDEAILDATGKIFPPKIPLYISESTSAFPDTMVPCDPSFCTEETSSEPQKTVFARPTYPDTKVDKNYDTNSRISLSKKVSIGGGGWQLKTSALYYKQSGSPTPYWIGLGLSGGSRQNFQSRNPIFSLSWNNAGGGTLAFGANPLFSNISNPSLVLSSDENWMMQLTSLSLDNETLYSSPSQPMPLHFELLFAIYFPKDIIKRLLKVFSTHAKECSPFPPDNTNNFRCSFDEIDSLPSLVFGLADGSSFKISPSVYTTSIGTKPKSYESVVFTYSLVYPDRIMIDPKILGNYHVFQRLEDGTHTISLYSPHSLAGNPKTVTTSPKSETLVQNSDKRTEEAETDHGTQGLGVDGGFQDGANKNSTSSTEIQVSEPPNTFILIIIGIVILGCVTLGFVGRKKGWFKKKTPLSPEQRNELVRLRNFQNEDSRSEN